MVMSTETLEELGLPPLPGSAPAAPPAVETAGDDERQRRANGATVGKSLRALAAAAPNGGRERAVVAAIESPKGLKAALRVLKGPQAKPRSHLETIDAVGGLLRLYDTTELDRLLLGCDPGERRFLLSCLIK